MIIKFYVVLIMVILLLELDILVNFVERVFLLFIGLSRYILRI